jgi:hypothetical protein
MAQVNVMFSRRVLFNRIIFLFNVVLCYYLGCKDKELTNFYLTLIVNIISHFDDFYRACIFAINAICIADAKDELQVGG